MRAHIYWKPKSDGGRSKPPTGVGLPSYATVVRFTDTGDPWPPENAWSLVIEKIASESDEFEWLANVRYLVDEAPHHELKPHRQFELYEGGKLVATGVILASQG